MLFLLSTECSPIRVTTSKARRTRLSLSNIYRHQPQVQSHTGATEKQIQSITWIRMMKDEASEIDDCLKLLFTFLQRTKVTPARV